MADIWDQANGQADQPHRHDYYTIVLVEQAKGQHHIDFREYPLASDQVYFIAPGQIHQLVAQERPRGWIITFTTDFLVANNIPDRFLSNLNLFQFFGESPPLTIDADLRQTLLRTVADMAECLASGLVYRDRALGALLQLFLIYSNNSCTLDNRQHDEDDPGVCLLRDFKQRVDRHYTDWHQVADYAADLHITAKHLSHTVRTLTGKTAKAFIQDRLTLEARRLLLHTNRSVKEIAYALGFTDPLHFSAFFKKQTQQSPSAFRDSPHPGPV